MPRLPTSLVLQAHRQHPLLSLLLQECRLLDSARNELRWLRERAVHDFRQRSGRRGAAISRKLPGWRSQLRSMCRARAMGVPLQYILGDQPFGDLEILCRRGVLIPRLETESYTFQTANWILNDMRRRSSLGAESDSSTKSLHILDLCTGTGCISLLLHALLAPHVKDLSILGIDLSATAIRLANKNLKHNLDLGLLQGRSVTDIEFRQGDVLGQRDINIPSVEDILRGRAATLMHDGSSRSSLTDHRWDILISNPPYISPTSFKNGTTSRSVRMYEPKLALVPPLIMAAGLNAIIDSCLQEDIFYPYLLLLSCRLQVRLTVLECGDPWQAERVAMLAESFIKAQCDYRNFTVEIWDWGETDFKNNKRCTDEGARAVVLQRQERY